MRVVLDTSGRLALPKSLRDHMRLSPGDSVSIEAEDDTITVKPIRPMASIKKECGMWVFQGEPMDITLSELIDRDREKRMLEWLR